MALCVFLRDVYYCAVEALVPFLSVAKKTWEIDFSFHKSGIISKKSSSPETSWLLVQVCEGPGFDPSVVLAAQRNVRGGIKSHALKKKIH